MVAGVDVEGRFGESRLGFWKALTVVKASPRQHLKHEQRTPSSHSRLGRRL